MPDLRKLHFYLPSEVTGKKTKKTKTGKITISKTITIIKKIDLSQSACLELEGRQHADTHQLFMRE